MKTILITGASSGIGYATAVKAANDGWKVIACGRNVKKLQQLALEHYAIEYKAFDLTDNAACKEALEDVEADAVLLNAGTCEYVDVVNWEPAMFKRVFDANFFSAVNCIAALLPNLKPGSQIAFVDSLARLLPFTRSQAYGASKAAMNYLAKTLEVDLADKEVHVKTISPGFVDTPLTAKNKFDMPMSVSTEQAAKYILNAINSKASSHYFPFVFSTIIRLMGMLPDSIKARIAKSLRSKESMLEEKQV